MSWQAVDWVVRHSPTIGTDRLVTLAIAEQCRDETPDDVGEWSAYPGLKRIAWYAGLKNERTAQTALKRMVKKGDLSIGPGPLSIRADRRPNRYGIPIAKGVHCGYDDECTTCTYYSGVRSESPRKRPRGAPKIGTGCAQKPSGVRSDAPRGDSGRTRTIENPDEALEEPSLPLPQKSELSKDIERRASYYVTTFGRQGRQSVADRMECAGYSTADIEFALAMLDAERRTA